jgi:hypothetical protein
MILSLSVMAFIQFKALVPKSLQKAGIKKQVEYSLALERAREIMKALMGEDIGDYANPAFIQRGTLTIAVLSSGAAAHLGIYEQDILSYVNEGFQMPVVKKIRLIR